MCPPEWNRQPPPPEVKQIVEVGATFSSTLSTATLKYLSKNLASKMNIKPKVFKFASQTDCTSLTIEFGPTSDFSIALRIDLYEDAVNAALNAAKEDEASELTAEWSLNESVFNVTCNV
jgi:hypothetical protein